jgi:hypothetical protein
MATTEYGVTIAMVGTQLPFDASNISATTQVTTSDVTQFIADASAAFTALLIKAGLLGDGGDPTTELGDDTLQQAREYIISAAVVKVLDALGFSGRARDNAAARERELYDRYAKRSELLVKRTKRVRSTVDTSASTRGDFTGTGYKF